MEEESRKEASNSVNSCMNILSKGDSKIQSSNHMPNHNSIGMSGESLINDPQGCFKSLVYPVKKKRAMSVVVRLSMSEGEIIQEPNEDDIN